MSTAPAPRNRSARPVGTATVAVGHGPSAVVRPATAGSADNAGRGYTPADSATGGVAKAAPSSRDAGALHASSATGTAVASSAFPVCLIGHTRIAGLQLNQMFDLGLRVCRQRQYILQHTPRVGINPVVQVVIRVV